MSTDKLAKVERNELNMQKKRPDVNAGPFPLSCAGLHAHLFQAKLDVLFVTTTPRRQLFHDPFPRLLLLDSTTSTHLRFRNSPFPNTIMTSVSVAGRFEQMRRYFPPLAKLERFFPDMAI